MFLIYLLPFYLIQKKIYIYFLNLGNESGKWFLDLKNGQGACGKGDAPSSADCTFVMKDDHFQQMFAGILKQCFLTYGKLPFWCNL